MRSLCGAVLVCAAIALGGVGTAHAGSDLRLVGVTWDGLFVEINPDTGLATMQTNLSVTRFNSLTSTPGGGLMGVRTEAGGPATLYTIDADGPSAAAVTTLSEAIDVRGLAAAADGDLFGVPFVSGPRNLGRIDPDTGGVTTIGPVMTQGGAVVTGIQALAMSPAGVLHAWGTSQGLVTIDTATAQAQYVDKLGFGKFLDLQSIAFHPSGRLFGATAFETSGALGPGYSLFEIDLITGRPTLIGGFGGDFDIRGIEFIPAPGGLALAAAGLAAVGARRRRR